MQYIKVLIGSNRRLLDSEKNLTNLRHLPLRIDKGKAHSLVTCASGAEHNAFEKFKRS